MRIWPEQGWKAPVRRRSQLQIGGRRASGLSCDRSRNFQPPGASHYSREFPIRNLVVDKNFFHRIPLQLASHANRDVAHLADHLVMSPNFYRRDSGRTRPDRSQQIVVMVIATQNTLIVRTEDGPHQRFGMGSHAGAADPDPALSS